MKKRIHTSTQSAILCLLLFLLGGLFAGENPPIPTDPAVTIGTLENGMTYYVRKNSEPKDRVTLRLAVKVGSLFEDDDQQGLAHFLEHMAFNGTKHFKKQELVDYLERIGTRFGADLNAHTSFEETVYKLQVPTDEPEILEQAFLIMQDWASAISLDAEEIEKERGVVIEEWRGSRGAQARIRDKQLQKLFHQSRYADRLPIGQVEILKHAKPETFRRFYKDWYRPDLMAIVVVGDIDPQWAVTKIKDTFSKLENPEKTRPWKTFPVPGHDETLFSINTDPELTTSMVEIYVKSPAKATQTLADYRHNMVRSLHQGMLSNRLSERTREAKPPFVAGFAYRGDMVSTMDAHVQGAMVKGDQFEEALVALVVETRRVQEHGFTDSELERQKKDMLRGLEQAFKERDKTNSAVLAGSYLDHFLTGDPIPGIENMLEIAAKFLPGITLDEVNHFSSRLGEKNRVVLLSAPEKKDLKVPAQEDILSYLEKGEKMEVTPYQDNVSDEPLLSKTPKPGKVVSEKHDEKMDVWDLRLANGARVILKSTDYKNDQILFNAFSLGGTSLVSDEDYVPAFTADTLVNQSGLASFKSIELEKKLAGKTLSINAYIDDLEEGFSGSASPADLETMLQLLHLYFTAPNVEDAIFQSIVTRFKFVVENREASPSVVFRDKINSLLYNDHNRRRPFDLEALGLMNREKSLRIFKERFGNGGDFTFFFVGNFEIEQIKPLLETYIGGLPASKERETFKDVGLDYVKGSHEVTVAKGLEQKASVKIIFTGEAPWSSRQRYVLQSLNQALNISLREILREELSGVYGVRAGGSLLRRPDGRYNTSITFDCDPEMVDKLVEAARKEVARVAEEGFEDKYLEKVKETQLRSYETGVRRNEFWLSNLGYYIQNDLELEGVLNFPEKVKSLTMEELKTAARLYYNKDNHILAILKPGEPEKNQQ